MERELGRQIAAWVAALLVLAAATVFPVVPASAQAPAAAPAPPMPSEIDEHGVDLTSGKLIFGGADVSIGPPDHHGLRFSRQWSKNAWRVAELPAMSGTTSYPVVSFGGRSVPFEPNGSGGYKAVFEDGSTLSDDRTTFTANDGTQIVFEANAYQYYTVESNLGVGTQIIFPDGVRWNYHYELAGAYLGPPLPPQCNPWPTNPLTIEYCESFAPEWYQVRRLSSITSSTGYEVKLHYVTNTLTYEGLAAWWQVTTATALNNAIEYCSPTAQTCSFANTWPQVTYSNWIDGKIDAVTGPTSATTNYSYSLSGSYENQLTGIRPPGASSNLITYGYTSGKVSSYSVGGGTWTYAYPSGTQTTVTDPSSNVRTTNYTSGGLVTSVSAGGQTTSFTYCGASEANCPKDLLKTMTQPEGNYVQYAYDARGNTTSVTHVAKAGSGLANIVTSATYPSSCTNQKTCNQPTSTTDGRGQVTDYTYDSGHGGLLTVTSPADANGVRPQTRISYSNYQAYYKNSTGSIVASGSNIALPSQVASCRTTSSCTNGADERKTVIGYGPQTAGVANNLNPVSAIVSRGDGALAATTALTYDNYSRVKTGDGPLSGTADTTFYSYNIAGQTTGVIGADPDGAGAALFPAVKYTYRSDGQIDYVQSGTVTAQSDAGWSSFSELQRQTAGYDSYHRPIRQTLSSGGTTYQVTDQRYDAAGRVLCTMQRMDAGNWGTLPSSCSPTQTSGPNGPDRVAYNHYDALGRVWKVTEAYGVTGQAGDNGISTFTSNGQLATLTDAEGNKTTYEYDGHDRLLKTRFPSPTTDGVSSTTDYEQVGYDANGNVTSFRTRAGETLTMTFDNLDRMITKVVPDRAGLDATHERDIYFGYDLFGNMTAARFDSWTGEGITHSFNTLGQLVGATTNMDGVSRALIYDYAAPGVRTRITHPDGNYFHYYRHGSGAFYYAALNGTAPLFYPTRDTAGRVNLLRRLNTSTAAWDFGTSLTFDAVSRRATLGHDPSGTTYDATTTLTYNPASQIVSRALSNDAFVWYDQVAVNRNYTANGLSQYSAVGGTSFGHDANGNLTSDGTQTYTYDIENRLVARSGGGTTATLRYDPLGRLHEVVGSATGTTRFLYDGDALVAEYNGSGTLLRRYVHGTGAGDDPLVWFEGSGLTDAERRYLYADERGSIVLATTSTGSAAQLYKYDEYGIPASVNSGRFQYTGQAWIPELGMYYYKARMYSPTLGRFMQADPIGYGDGMNMYAYVGGDPVNKVDYTGLKCTWLDGCVTIFVNGSPSGPPPAGKDSTPSYDAGDDPEIVVIGTISRKVWEARDEAGRLAWEGLKDWWEWYNSPSLEERLDAWYAEKIDDLISDAPCCFTSGTLISTPDGPKRIETLAVGDLVLSRSDSTSETAAKPIVGITPAHYRHIWIVTVSYQGNDGRWHDERFETTEDHPWRTMDGQWRITSALNPGIVVARQRGTAVVVSVVDTQETKLTYNLEIADFHTYFVGDSEVWVHNACSKALAKAMIAAGVARPQGSAAHHIAAKGRARAEPARKTLEKFGIGIDSAENGVFLPGREHRQLHTNAYYDAVNAALSGATSRAEAINVLGLIRMHLLRYGRYP